MNIVKTLAGARSSKVELVEIDQKQYVLKTAEIDEIKNEKEFYRLLSEHAIPTLHIYEAEDVKENQLLLEYVEGSPTLGRHMTYELVEAWGGVVRQMHDITYTSAANMSTLNVEEMNWQEFLEDILKKSEKKTSLPQHLVQNIKQKLLSLFTMKPTSYALLHADLHTNNVLIRGNELCLFDKGSDVFYGDPLYDLAIIGIEFPHETFITVDDPEHFKDREYLDRFIAGYGRDFTKDPAFELYVLLRAFERFPNPFEKYLKETMQGII